MTTIQITCKKSHCLAGPYQKCKTKWGGYLASGCFHAERRN